MDSGNGSCVTFDRDAADIEDEDAEAAILIQALLEDGDQLIRRGLVRLVLDHPMKFQDEMH